MAPLWTATTCFQQRFFVHGQFHAETALRIEATCIARTASRFFMQQWLVFLVLGDRVTVRICWALPNQMFICKPRKGPEDKGEKSSVQFFLVLYFICNHDAYMPQPTTGSQFLQTEISLHLQIFAKYQGSPRRALPFSTCAKCKRWTAWYQFLVFNIEAAAIIPSKFESRSWSPPPWPRPPGYRFLTGCWGAFITKSLGGLGVASIFFCHLSNLSAIWLISQALNAFDFCLKTPSKVEELVFDKNGQLLARSVHFDNMNYVALIPGKLT